MTHADLAPALAGGPGDQPVQANGGQGQGGGGKGTHQAHVEAAQGERASGDLGQGADGEHRRIRCLRGQRALQAGCEYAGIGAGAAQRQHQVADRRGAQREIDFRRRRTMQALLADIADHADEGLGAAIEHAHLLAQRIIAAQIAVDEGLVDQGLAREHAVAAVGLGEAAAGGDRDAEGAEIIRADETEFHQALFRQIAAGDIEAAIPAGLPRCRQGFAEGHGFHAGQCRQRRLQGVQARRDHGLATGEPVLEFLARRHHRRRQGDAGGEHPLRLHQAGFDRRQPLQAGDQQAGANQQDHRQRDLTGDQHRARTGLLPAAGLAARGALHGLQRIGPRRPPRRPDREQRQGKQGQAGTGGDDAQVQHRHMPGGQQRRRQRQQAGDRQRHHGQRQHGAEQGDPHRFGQHLAEQAAAAGAQRPPQGPFLAPGLALRQHQAGQVGAGDQQHHGGGGQQQRHRTPQGGADQFAQGLHLHAQTFVVIRECLRLPGGDRGQRRLRLRRADAGRQARHRRQ